MVVRHLSRAKPEKSKVDKDDEWLDNVDPDPFEEWPPKKKPTDEDKWLKDIANSNEDI